VRWIARRARSARRLWSDRGGDEAVAEVKLSQLQQSGTHALPAAQLPICREPGQSYTQPGVEIRRQSSLAC
jgi:hypothetical protein